MSSFETKNSAKSQEVPPPKPFRRRLSFKTKPLSASSREGVGHNSSNSANNGNIMNSGFNSVRGSIRRFRRVSGTVNNSNNASNFEPPVKSLKIRNEESNPITTTTTTTTTTMTITSSSSATMIQRLGAIALQKSRLMDMNISDLKAVVEEKGAELGSMAVELGSMAKETGFGWGKKGKEAVVDRWKKKKEDSPSNTLLHSTVTQKYLANINIFGAPLKLAVRITRVDKDRKCIHKDPARYWLPAIMIRCLEFLDMYGSDEVGLYRIPGSTITVARMRAIFNAGADLNFLQSTAEDPHAVATLLKMYIREIPQPILTEPLVTEFNSCVARYSQLPSAATQPTFLPGSPPKMSTTYYTAPTTVPEGLPLALAPIVSRLPPYHFYLLRSLCKHLALIDDKSKINKMNLSNLGLIFCPNLGIGSILFKAFVGHLDIVFGGGCQNEEQEIAEEESERAAKEKDAPEVYRKTNISGDFSKSFEDLLIPESGNLTQSSNHSACSSSSSSFTSSLLNKDNSFSHLDSDQNHSLIKSVLDGDSYLVVPSMKKTQSSSSLSSTSSKANSGQSIKDTNNPFGDDEFASPLTASPSSVHEQKTTHLAINNPSPPKVSNNPFFRLRSQSTGTRNVPLEFSSSESSADETNPGDFDDEPNSPTFMSFDYFDKDGAKNLGVLNLSVRSSQWILHHNGVDGDRGTATAAWIRRRRPSMEEQEKWKRNLLAEDLSAGDESASEAGDSINEAIPEEDEEQSILKKAGKNGTRGFLLGSSRKRESIVAASRKVKMPVTTGLNQVQVPVGDLINL
ncbi:hypothetical protein G9A89_017404 [Geosiphon pyriformis]|nr:hypothetical protein G9A89_017404 [Geosiphon pyriformis]